MTAGPNDNTLYTAQDIERYHAGHMSVQEMHALEKAALDDPFLADALEGYKFTQTPAEDVAVLKELLAQKTEPENVVPLVVPRKRSYPLLRIAALFLLLLGAGWSVYYLMDSKRDKLALDTKQSSKPVPATAPVRAAAPDTAVTIQVTPKNEGAFTQPAPLNAMAKAPAEKQVVKETEDWASVEPITAPPVTAAAPPVANIAVADSTSPMARRADISNDESITTKSIVARRQAMPEALQGRVAGVDLRQAPAIKSFQGRVVDQNNQGVPHATVAIRGTNTGTTTDDKGNFSLKATDTSVNATVAAVGYESKNVTLSNQQSEANIVLNESTQNLQEVVVTGMGVNRKKSEAASATLPEPTKGWQYFEEYVTQNRLSGKELDTETLSGSVTLSFDVNRKGEPTNIKVESPLSPSLDAEAIRLLQKGPKWQRKKNTRGKVTIQFP